MGKQVQVKELLHKTWLTLVIVCSTILNFCKSFEHVNPSLFVPRNRTILCQHNITDTELENNSRAESSMYMLLLCHSPLSSNKMMKYMPQLKSYFTYYMGFSTPAIPQMVQLDLEPIHQGLQLATDYQLKYTNHI